MDNPEAQAQDGDAETPTQKQARLRRERREAKIKAGGSARLDKITNLSGRQNLPGTFRASACVLTPCPETIANTPVYKNDLLPHSPPLRLPSTTIRRKSTSPPTHLQIVPQTRAMVPLRKQTYVRSCGAGLLSLALVVSNSHRRRIR